MDADINIGHQAGAAVLTVFLLDWLKRANWFPWLSNHTETLNRILSIVIACATTAGFKIIDLKGDINHGGSIGIAFPPLVVLLDTVMHASAQFGGQEMLHKLLGNHQIGKEILLQQAMLTESVKQLEAPKG